MNKAGKYLLERLRALIASFMQNCKSVIWADLATTLVLQEILRYYLYFLWDASYLTIMQSR